MTKLKVNDYIEANPFSGNPIDPEEMDLLVNRKEEKEHIDSVISSASKGFIEHFSILGEDGMGKTSILNYVYAKCVITEGIFYSRIDFTQETKEEIFIKFLIKDLLNQTKVGFGNFILGLVGMGRKEKKNLIIKRLEGFEISTSSSGELKDPLFGIATIASQISEKKGRPEDIFEVSQLLNEVVKILRKDIKAIIIIFDEGQYVATNKSIDLLQRMRLLFQKKPFVLCIGGSPLLFTQLSQIEPTFVNLFSQHNRLKLKSFEEKHILELIKKRLNQVRKTGKGIEPFNPGTIQTLLQESNGNPRYIVRISSSALYLARNENSVTPNHILEASDQIHIDLGRDIFERLSEDLQQILVTVGRWPNSSFEEIRRYMGNVPKATICRKLNNLSTLGYIKIIQAGKAKRCSLIPALFKFYKLVFE